MENVGKNQNNKKEEVNSEIIRDFLKLNELDFLEFVSIDKEGNEKIIFAEDLKEIITFALNSDKYNDLSFDLIKNFIKNKEFSFFFLKKEKLFLILNKLLDKCCYKTYKVFLKEFLEKINLELIKSMEDFEEGQLILDLFALICHDNYFKNIDSEEIDRFFDMLLDVNVVSKNLLKVKISFPEMMKNNYFSLIGGNRKSLIKMLYKLSDMFLIKIEKENIKEKDLVLYLNNQKLHDLIKSIFEFEFSFFNNECGFFENLRTGRLSLLRGIVEVWGYDYQEFLNNAKKFKLSKELQELIKFGEEVEYFFSEEVTYNYLIQNKCNIPENFLNEKIVPFKENFINLIAKIAGDENNFFFENCFKLKKLSFLNNIYEKIAKENGFHLLAKKINTKNFYRMCNNFIKFSLLEELNKKDLDGNTALDYLFKNNIMKKYFLMKLAYNKKQPIKEFVFEISNYFIDRVKDLGLEDKNIVNYLTSRKFDDFLSQILLLERCFFEEEVEKESLKGLSCFRSLIELWGYDYDFFCKELYEAKKITFLYTDLLKLTAQGKSSDSLISDENVFNYIVKKREFIPKNWFDKKVLFLKNDENINLSVYICNYYYNSCAAEVFSESPYFFKSFQEKCLKDNYSETGFHYIAKCFWLPSIFNLCKKLEKIDSSLLKQELLKKDDVLEKTPVDYLVENCFVLPVFLPSGGQILQELVKKRQLEKPQVSFYRDVFCKNILAKDLFPIKKFFEINKLLETLKLDEKTPQNKRSI